MNLKETLTSLIQSICVKGFTSSGLADAISQAIDVKSIAPTAQNPFDIVSKVRENPTMRIQKWVTAYDGSYAYIVGGPTLGANRSVFIEAIRQTTGSGNADFSLVLIVKNGDMYIGTLYNGDNTIVWTKVATSNV